MRPWQKFLTLFDIHHDLSGRIYSPASLALLSRVPKPYTGQLKQRSFTFDHGVKFYPCLIPFDTNHTQYARIFFPFIAAASNMLTKRLLEAVKERKKILIRPKHEILLLFDTHHALSK